MKKSRALNEILTSGTSFMHNWLSWQMTSNEKENADLIIKFEGAFLSCKRKLGREANNILEMTAVRDTPFELNM